jgi:glycosyltransferase involved in cell wall biosynthesis
VLHSDAPFCEAMADRFIRGSRENAFAAAVCVSSAIEQMASQNNRNDVRVVRIPCGAPVPETGTVRKAGVLRVLYAGRMTQDAKRAVDVAQAFCDTAAAAPNTEFTMVGAGPESDTVAGVIRGSPNVHFRGVAAPDEMPAVFSRHDVIVLLSDYEGLPISLIEAMASGLVPVCLAIRSGIAEVIEDGVNGLLVSDRGQSFTSAIRKLSEDSDLVARLGSAARATVEREYSAHINNARWANLLDELGSAARPSRVTVTRRIGLPAPEPAFGSEDLRRPPLADRIAESVRAAWFNSRQRLRPRARLREWRQSSR